MVVSLGGGEAVYSPMIRSQSFSEPISLGYDLYKCFSAFPPFPLAETGRLEGAGIRYFLAPWSAGLW